MGGRGGGERERGMPLQRGDFKGGGEEREKKALISPPSPPFLLFSILLFLQKCLIRRLCI